MRRPPVKHEPHWSNSKLLNMTLSCWLDIFFTIDSEYIGLDDTARFGFLRVQPTLINKRKINDNFIFKLIFSESKSHLKYLLFIALKEGINLDFSLNT